MVNSINIKSCKFLYLALKIIYNKKNVDDKIGPSVFLANLNHRTHLRVILKVFLQCFGHLVTSYAHLCNKISFFRQIAVR